MHLELSGKRAIAYYRFQRIPAEQTFTHFEDKPRFEEVEQLANRYIAAYTAGRLDRVDVAYVKFLNAARQIAVVETLLPLGTVSGPGGRRQARDNTAPKQPVQYEFLPGRAIFWKSWCPRLSKPSFSNAFLMPRSASKSPGAWP